MGVQVSRDLFLDNHRQTLRYSSSEVRQRVFHSLDPSTHLVQVYLQKLRLSDLLPTDPPLPDLLCSRPRPQNTFHSIQSTGLSSPSCSLSIPSVSSSLSSGHSMTTTNTTTTAATSNISSSLQGNITRLTPRVSQLRAPSEFERLFLLAHAGHIEAFYPLGLCYLHGWTPDHHADFIEALAWFEQAADKQDDSSVRAMAQYQVGILLAIGNGIRPNIPKALEILHMAAIINPQAQYALGLYCERDLLTLVPSVDRRMRARTWYERAAKQGLSDAQTGLAMLLLQYVDTWVDESLLLSAEDQRQVLVKSAIHWLTLASEQDNIRALLQLGSLYEQGDHVPQNHRKALCCYEQAASIKQASSNATALAHYLVGINYRFGQLGTTVDLSRALDHLGQSANKGYAPAQRALGMMYAEGIGVSCDKQQAHALYTKAACQGDLRALGLLCQQRGQGRDCLIGLEDALALYGVAAQAGSITFQMVLADIYQQQEKWSDAFFWYKRASKESDITVNMIYGDIALATENVLRSKKLLNTTVYEERQRQKARLMVGRYRILGLCTPKDPGAGFNQLLTLANEGYDEAYYWLGACYEEGVRNDHRRHKDFVVQPCLTRAFDYYKKSALMGHVDGQFQTALMLANGLVQNNKIILKKNGVEAFLWYTKAAESGHCTALYSLGLYYLYGMAPLTQIDHRRAQSIFEQAAKQNNPDAMVQLAKILLDPISNYPSRHPEAIAWLKKAADEHHNPEGLCAMAQVYETGRGLSPLNTPEEQTERHRAGFCLLEEAASRGFPKAWCEIARYHEHGWSVPRSTVTALECLEKAEKLGYAKAGLLWADLLESTGKSTGLAHYDRLITQHPLLSQVGWLARLAKAKLILKGRGSTEDEREVRSYLRDMTEQNAKKEALVEPFEMLGALCETQNLDLEAMTWYDAALDTLHPATHWIQIRARFHLAKLCVRHQLNSKALGLARQLEPFLTDMNQHNSETRRQARETRYLLGCLLETSDPVSAKRWFCQAADEGEGAAAYMLAKMAIDNGKEEEAKERYEQGVSAGHASCMRAYALLLAQENFQNGGWDGRETIEWLERAAHLGDVESLVELGNIYQQGIWVDKVEADRALAFFLSAAQHGNSLAMVRAAELYHCREDYREAAAWFSKADTRLAQVMLASYRLQGHALQQDDLLGFLDLCHATRSPPVLKDGDDIKAYGVGCYLLGQCYEFGRGTGSLSNVSEARKWYQKAANTARHTDAMWRLGVICSDEKVSLEWYRKAAEQGHCESQYQMGLYHGQGCAGLDQNTVAGRKYLVKAARQGHAKAKYELARVLFSQGDYYTAVQLYRDATLQKVPEALRELGHLYHQGLYSKTNTILPQSYTTAFELYYDSALLGDGMAALMVGSYFENGYAESIEKDSTKALEWYETASEFNCGPLADLAIGNIKHTMAEKIEDSTEADTWRDEAYKRFLAASQQDGSQREDASLMVGLYHLHGWGHSQPKDPDRGFKWLFSMAQRGDIGAFVQVAKCYEKGFGVEQDMRKALAYWEMAAELEDKEALLRLGDYHQQGLVGPVDLVKARQYSAFAEALDTTTRSETSYSPPPSSLSISSY
ncbi:hypothetical protein J3Q64DRAFT_1831641 [Phycomyces blakesleeanus]|uniref:Uncharacterized protein n=2 Tax=Phycomyces blakesleeanus TaxID=4837 RepID=A0A167LES9_PHYB8|nr:hypothetical protein PHYBLDRAFT_60196 [Phycomyces blakesleeanus NRRL 1555(-)]OAD70295.1 hypothetical protein PHYBLDRAFT_60196 [Phycomyces blakesleeanus NRRL 1555(-)]|eukprot:XP_018288335.1 hypothetical protein PHYBLDRAFT_60196 [Phycomyces blakesleeanus NRRL 1555(-)]